MDAFDAALRRLFMDANLSVPAVFTAAPGAPELSIRAMLLEPQDAVAGLSHARAIAGAYQADILAGDVPVAPTKQSRLVIDGVSYKVADVTRAKRGKVWSMALVTNA